MTNDFEGDGPGEGPPSISGDGTKIAFEKFIYGSDSDEPVACEIFVVNSDGSELKQLTNNSEGSCKVPSQEPSISGDGSKIAFKRVDFNTWDRGIFVINSDGTGEKQLTNSTHFDEQPSINYDGSKIAFLGGDDFDHQIFVINSDGTGLTQLTDDSERSFMFPSISDNGEKIAFWRAFWRHPESEVDFEYEVGISLVSYLSDVDDKNGVPQDESFLNLPLIIALAATIGVLGFTFIVHNRRRQGTWTM